MKHSLGKLWLRYLNSLGIAIGYPDWDDPINGFRSAREPLDEVAKWYDID